MELYVRLCGLFKTNRLPSSLLFAGKKGVGKWAAANALAKTITCLQSDDSFCGECASCRQAKGFFHPDIYYLFPLPKDEDKAEKLYLPYLQQKQQKPFSDGSEDVTSFVTIDNIRKFQSNLARFPSLSKFKVGIIYEAERMLPATMDALLKTLEEPPRDSFLIVCTDQPRFLLSTIRSRLQRVSFPALEASFVESHIRGNFEVTEKDARIIARFAAGTLYNVEQYVDKAFFEARETAFELLVTAVTSSGPDLVIKSSTTAALESRDRVERLLVHWQSMLRDLMVINSLPLQTGVDPSPSLVNFDYADRYLEHRERFGSLKATEIQIEKLEKVRNELRRNVNPRMAAISILMELNSQKSM
jgi:DNA polymerase III subunit delta'